MPTGMSSNKIVTSVAPPRSSSVIVIVMPPLESVDLGRHHLRRLLRDERNRVK